VKRFIGFNNALFLLVSKNHPKAQRLKKENGDIVYYIPEPLSFPQARVLCRKLLKEEKEIETEFLIEDVKEALRILCSDG
jgi:hypothetical protein